MKKFRKKTRQNNRGLTLIEMVVTVAIIGIISAVVLSVVATSAGFFRGVSNSTRSQAQLQELMDDVENIVIDANTYISLSGSGGKQTLTIENQYDQSWYRDILEWVPAEIKVYYTRKTNATESVYKKIPRSAIGENVEDFSIDIGNIEKDRTVEFKATVNNRGKKDTATRTVHLRNQVTVK